MSGDCCKTVTMEVTIQENGIIRNAKGYLIARLVDEVEFESEHIQENKK